MKRVGWLCAVVLSAVMVSSLAVLPAAAQFPSKPITLIIGFAPGGPSDVMARILTKKMEEILKQPVVVENRAGAGGGIAATAVARAAPDGYTILLATGSSLAINVSLYKNLGYDPEKDFEPICLIGTQTNLLYTHPGSVPAKTLDGVRRLREGQSRQAHLRLGRHRHARASRGRASEGRGQYRDDACAVPRHRAGAAKRDRRPRAGRVQSAVAACCRICRAARCAASPSPRCSARRRCPTCRPSPRAAIRASTPRPGTRSWRRPACRRTSPRRCRAPSARR